MLCTRTSSDGVGKANTRQQGNREKVVAGQLSGVGGDTNERNRKNNTTADALTS